MIRENSSRRNLRGIFLEQAKNMEIFVLRVYNSSCVTENARIAQPVRVSPSHGGGPGFESQFEHHFRSLTVIV